jgi:hypothetical protein
MGEPAWLIDLADLGVLLGNAFSDKPWAVLLFVLSVTKRNWSERKLIVMAQRRWPEAPFVWNRYRIRKLVDEGKQCVDEHLQDVA